MRRSVGKYLLRIDRVIPTIRRFRAASVMASTEGLSCSKPFLPLECLPILSNPLPQCPRPGSAGRSTSANFKCYFCGLQDIRCGFFCRGAAAGYVVARLLGLQPLHGCSFLGAIGLSPHSRLRRQCGVIHNVTARAVKIAGNQMFRYDV